jgi:hypothetical protein
MKDQVEVTNASYVSNYTLNVTFSDGLSAEIDFHPWIEKFPFFAPLKDIAYFKNFEIDGWTVSWPNGADIAPETLHEIAVRQSQLQTA